MACPACGSDLVMAVLKPGIGIVRQCGSCSVALASDEPEPVTPYTPAEPPKPAPRPAPAAVAAPPRAKLTARSVVADAKAEARALRKSIAAHERALTRERRQLAALDRLLDAAAGKPRAVVRAIRTTA
jgi:hypothetical protein